MDYWLRDPNGNGRFAGVPTRVDLERVFFLDDEDLVLVAGRWGEYSRLGFALQLVTVRWPGTFLEDRLDVPVVVLDFVAGRLGISDPSVVGKYLERRTTLFEHQRLIREADVWLDFSAA